MEEFSVGYITPHALEKIRTCTESFFNSRLNLIEEDNERRFFYRSWLDEMKKSLAET